MKTVLSSPHTHAHSHTIRNAQWPDHLSHRNTECSCLSFALLSSLQVKRRWREQRCVFYLKWRGCLSLSHPVTVSYRRSALAHQFIKPAALFEHYNGPWIKRTPCQKHVPSKEAILYIIMTLRLKCVCSFPVKISVSISSVWKKLKKKKKKRKLWNRSILVVSCISGNNGVMI